MKDATFDNLINDIKQLQDLDKNINKLLKNAQQLLLSTTDESFEFKKSSFGKKEVKSYKWEWLTPNLRARSRRLAITLSRTATPLTRSRAID